MNMTTAPTPTPMKIHWSWRRKTYQLDPYRVSELIDDADATNTSPLAMRTAASTRIPNADGLHARTATVRMAGRDTVEPVVDGRLVDDERRT